MRQDILNALKMHFTAEIMKHKMNVEVMLNNPIAIHDHTDLMAAIENEISIIAEYTDKLEVLEAQFEKK
jgi:hypothetical protein